jgi:hypothetical protein
MQPESLTFAGAFAEAVTDTEAGRPIGLIRGVLLCGETSLNGRQIPTPAFGGPENVKRLYENVHVYLNHDIENGPSRRVEELAAVVVNARLVRGRPFGDLLLSDSHAGKELRSLYEFSKKAEKSGASLKNLGISHVARYTFSSHGTGVVQSVDEVLSCDVVVRPATTKSFHESSHMGRVPETTAAEFLELIGGDGRIVDQVDYAYNERALFDPTYNRDDARFDSSDALSTLAGHSAEGSKALASISFI